MLFHVSDSGTKNRAEGQALHARRRNTTVTVRVQSLPKKEEEVNLHHHLDVLKAVDS
jgi:hypothetical protein